MKKTLGTTILLIGLGLALSACGAVNLSLGPGSLTRPEARAAQRDLLQTPGVLEELQRGYANVYTQVSPSVVNIQTAQADGAQGGIPGFQSPFGNPGPQFRQGSAGSGVVWDREGHIVTNNHVVEGAERITVTFPDGTSTGAQIVGQDSDSDLAVIQVDVSLSLLKPIAVADSTQVQVGDIAIAIGNPFGLEGTMTAGVVSALGRTLPAGTSTFFGPSYTIPDVIQTDAPINPGSSGGALVNIRGELIGLTTAIESPVGVNAGIGFVVPSVIVQKIVPALIETGFYAHPVIGISGRTLDSRTAQAMDLGEDQRGALVLDVTPDGPADEAGLRGSDQVATIDGQEVRLGGDVINAIDGQPVRDFEDLAAYLARYADVGDTVTLSILRNGEAREIEITLGAREGTPAPQETVTEARGNAWLGISGVTLTPDIAGAMDWEGEVQGALVQRVFSDSPAERAGLQGSDKRATVDGASVLIGGDVIVAVDGDTVEDMPTLQALIADHRPGDDIVLTIVRDGERTEVEATLAARPDS
jgi:serine protease Do